ncbi:ATP-binding cassette domain-containing protein [Corynebacterium camporealensis]|uniref:ATP-binding cassette domain-containing protein n=1 Tax=Corynebacterium camporealensis TaxID=161896 RepID=UPI0034CF969E
MLVTSRLTKDYRSGSRHKFALKNVSVSFPGGVTSLIGPNGSGKSTLMRVLTTVEKPTSGHFAVDGYAIERAVVSDYRMRIGYVPQEVRFVPRMRVREALEYAGWVAGMSRADYHARVAEVLSLVGLSDKEHHRVGSLSGGQTRRLGIAAALMHQPSIYFLDEPSAGLDPQARIDVRNIIKEIGASATVVVSSHFTDDVAGLSNHVVTLNQGRVSFEGTWEELHQATVASGAGANSVDPLEGALSYLGQKELP